MPQIILVRHAAAGRRDSWQGDDRLRPLSRRGLLQADQLPRTIGVYQPSRVVSSPYLRCLQTVWPLSATTALPIERSDLLAPSAGPDAIRLVREVLDGGAGEVGGTVLCTHREVLVELIPAVAREFRITLPHRLPGAKGATWVLGLENPPARSTCTYLPQRSDRVIGVLPAGPEMIDSDLPSAWRGGGGQPMRDRDGLSQSSRRVV